MNGFQYLAGLLSVALLFSGCSTAPRRTPQAASTNSQTAGKTWTVSGPESTACTTCAKTEELNEEKVKQAEAEALAAKLENDKREAELASASKPKDPYLK